MQTADVLRCDFPGMITFENLSRLDLSSSIIDLGGRQQNSNLKMQGISLAVEAINYVIRNLRKVANNEFLKREDIKHILKYILILLL